ncbi:MAG: hypothetical protein H6621_05465 [Halobacteriovoraceae bacterium]|nr:hypothetical protein [Halobacteriovoraceae bacterium]
MTNQESNMVAHFIQAYGQEYNHVPSYSEVLFQIHEKLGTNLSNCFDTLEFEENYSDFNA